MEDSEEGLSKKKYEHLLETIWDITASRRVKEIVVGVTARPNDRTASYVRNDVGNIAILVTKKTSKIALEIERELFESIRDENYWKAIKRKYHKKKIAGVYHPSLGGTSKYDGKDYSVYVAWKNR